MRKTVRLRILMIAIEDTLCASSAQGHGYDSVMTPSVAKVTERFTCPAWVWGAALLTFGPGSRQDLWMSKVSVIYAL